MGDTADTRVVIEQRPLSDSIDAPGSIEPRLELVPALDDPELVELETEDDPAADAVADEALEVEGGPAARDLETLEGAVQAQDPLKLYVRSIGGGPLLT